MQIESDIIKFFNKKIDTSFILIFDLDGTLVDTDTANLLSYKDAIQQIMNIDITLLLYSNQRFTRNVLKNIIPILSDIQYDEIIRLKNNLFNKYLNETKLNSYTFEILQKYSGLNTIILSTNSNKERAIKVLKFHNIFDKFNYRFYKDDVKSKRKMSKFEYIMKIMKILPSRMIIFENEELEIDLALSLGILPENIVSV
jgi:beta-phosphoglucomutase-like phosphatase (HAD superfamily)